MASSKRKMHAYTEEAMQNALKEVQKGMRVATAAKLFEVPRVTLLYKSKGTTPPYRRMGPESVLSSEEERRLVEWIISAKKAGFHIGMNELFNSVQWMISNNKRPNPFRNNRPGRTWFFGFKRRNPKVVQYLFKSRVYLTKEGVARWFEVVKNCLGNVEVFKDPRRVFNGNELALFLNTDKNKGLLVRNDKNMYQFNSDDSEYLSVFLTGNANGDFVPSLIVFKDNFPENITNSLPENWGIGKTDSGWVNSEIFFNFIAKVFHPYIIRKNISFPVVLFIDPQKSYLTLHVSDFCDKHGIILLALYPKATHLMHPMEVSVFANLKDAWNKTLQNRSKPSSLEFPYLLEKTLRKIPANAVRQGFSKTGLYPWNPMVLETEFTFSENAKQIQANVTKENVQELRAGLEFLEKYVEKSKIEEFKGASDEWKGNIEDFGLFKLWRETTQSLRNLNVCGFDPGNTDGDGIKIEEETN